jgi:DtxR family Mn-dependent transcriptional regulator
MKLSITEENYLKAIFSLSSNDKVAVNTNNIAEHLSMKPASITDMVKKLSAKNLVIYEKYKGTALTPEGSKIALEVIRKHRLWETFLVEKLNFKWDEVHDLAEQLEHIKSHELVKRLDDFLGNPKFDPHGDPIPDKNGMINFKEPVLLNTLKIQKTGVVIGVNDSSDLFLKYLNKLEISLGTQIRLIEKIPFDNSLEILINDHLSSVIISAEVAGNIYIKN